MSKKLFRSRKQKMIAGICGGFAEYMGWDVTIVRLIYVILALFVGAGILVYIIAWIIIPLEPAGRFDGGDCVDADYEIRE